MPVWAQAHRLNSIIIASRNAMIYLRFFFMSILLQPLGLLILRMREGPANPSRYGKDNGICRLDLPFADLRMGDGAA